MPNHPGLSCIVGQKCRHERFQIVQTERKLQISASAEICNAPEGQICLLTNAPFVHCQLGLSVSEKQLSCSLVSSFKDMHVHRSYSQLPSGSGQLAEVQAESSQGCSCFWAAADDSESRKASNGLHIDGGNVSLTRTAMKKLRGILKTN